jgi:GrpB-like predicted nucleotidyltransferase (UPF0157 family)
MKIKIEEYNSEWSIQFQQIEDNLKIILGKLNPRIEHFGSTSVPGLASKPIIDILVGLERTSLLDETIEPMIKHNYIYFQIYNSDMPYRRHYVGLNDKSDPNMFQSIYSNKDKIPYEELQQHKLSHIHIWEYGTSEWNRHIAFRDYLREHPMIKTHYAQLKKALSQRDWKDGNEYNDGKDDFIKAEEANAILWYEEKKKQQLTKDKEH